MEKKFRILSLILGLTMATTLAFAAGTDNATQSQELTVIENNSEKQTASTEQATGTPAAENKPKELAKLATYEDPLRYTLGPDDVIEIEVMRHPEFSGTFPINLEGKIQYKFVGDIEVSGLTKKQLEEKITNIISGFIISPDVTVTIMEYKSKIIYVLGEVGGPGKYYMRSDTIPIRDAVVAAGLPTLSAAMRKCRIVSPDKSGKAKIKYVDLYAVLYGGDLKKNINMYPGDVLYVPATVMAKIVRVISPVTNTVGTVAAGPSSASSGKDAAAALAR